MSSPDWDAAPPYGGPPQPWSPSPHHGPPQYGPQQYGPPPYGPPPYGPPQYGPPPYGPPQQWGPPPYGHPGYPPPGWGPNPHYPPFAPYPVRPGQRPGPVIAAAVIAFAATLLVLVGTVYALAFSALLSLARGPGSGIGTWVALVQLVLAALLVVGGLRVLSRDRRWLLAAAAGQLVMSLYWVAALDDLVASTFDEGIVVLPLLYGALAVVAGGLLFLPEARAWTAGQPRPADDGGAGAGS